MTTAPRAPMPPPRSERGWPAPRWRSRSTGSCATSRARCRQTTAPTRPSSRSSPTAVGRRPSSSFATTPPTCSPPRCSSSIPGVKISIGPAIENGFYYDFEFPDGVVVNDADFPAHRGGDEGSTSTPTSRSCARTSAWRTRCSASIEEKQPYKVELIEDLIKNEARHDRLALHQRPLHRPVPRPARAHHQAHQGVQAPVGGRLLLARRRQPPDAHARVWDGVLLRQGPQGVRGAAGAGPRQRPPQARPRAAPVHVLRARARHAAVAAGRAWRSGTS